MSGPLAFQNRNHLPACSCSSCQTCSCRTSMRVRRVGISCSASGRTHRNVAKVADEASVGDGEGNLGSATKAVRNTCLGDGGDCSCRMYTGRRYRQRWASSVTSCWSSSQASATARLSLKLKGAMQGACVDREMLGLSFSGPRFRETVCAVEI